MRRALFLSMLLLGALPIAALQRRPAARAEAFLERWETMTEDEREKALSQLPPERRARAEARLKRLELMPEEKRASLRRRYEEFQSLPEDRRDALRLELQALRNMRPMVRRRRINSPEFRRQYSQEEQRLLRQAMGF